MEIKKYKVVCSQPLFSEEIYIDIAPYDNVTHEQIFFSRQTIHKQTSTKLLQHLYGSIYLTDKDGEISIEFPKPQAEKGTLEYISEEKQYNALTPKIISRYKQMRSLGQDCTLFIQNITTIYSMPTNTGDERRNSPQTPQEERLNQLREQFTRARNTAKLTENKRASETIPPWLRFQRDYTGD